jgi:acetylornithine deacetylase
LALRSDLEERVVAVVREARDELVSLTGELIACDTTARDPGEPPREEEKLQRILERRLSALGAETDLWEPEPIVPGHPYVAAELDFAGRPQLVARLRGAGGGPSVLLNGHVDAVAAGPRELWTSDPFRPELRDGKLYGRGSCDMKGGLTTLAFAVEALRRAGVLLRGDVVFCSNTDEESSGVGGWAAVRHGVRADAGICAEPTGFDAFAGCRGTATGVLTVPGRAGHVEMPQPHWRAGGAVNAIEKALPLLESMGRLRDEWRTRPDQRHAILSPSSVTPTIIRAGEWSVTYPESCTITCDLDYLPVSVDEAGTGRPAQREVEEWVGAVAAADPWLAENPPSWKWVDDCPPAEVPADHGIVTGTLQAAADLGREGRISGLDSWHDAATYTLLGGTPTISFGPGQLLTAHSVDEHVPVDDLVDHAAAVALLLMRWCGVADSGADPA